jgi:hypothetical protein
MRLLDPELPRCSALTASNHRCVRHATISFLATRTSVCSVHALEMWLERASLLQAHSPIWMHKSRSAIYSPGGVQ